VALGPAPQAHLQQTPVSPGMSVISGQASDGPVGRHSGIAAIAQALAGEDLALDEAATFLCFSAASACRRSLDRSSTCCLFDSLVGSAADSGGRFLSLSRMLLPLASLAAFLASLSRLSFSRRSCFDSYSCQSPSSLASLRGSDVSHGESSRTCEGGNERKLTLQPVVEQALPL